MEPDRRARAATALAERGLAFVIIDEASYGEEGLALLRTAFAEVTSEERRFPDGTGVTVLVLGGR